MTGFACVQGAQQTVSFICCISTMCMRIHKQAEAAYVTTLTRAALAALDIVVPDFFCKAHDDTNGMTSEQQVVMDNDGAPEYSSQARCGFWWAAD